MIDSKDFQDAESIRSGHSHVTSRPVSFPPHPIPEGMLSRSIGMPSRREGPPSIWDTHGISGNSRCVIFSTLSAGIVSMEFQYRRAASLSTVEKSERRTQDQDPRCQSGQSAKNSVIFSGGDSSKNYGADQQRLQISDLHLTNSLHQPRLLAGRYDSRPRYVLVHNFLRKLCIGSKKWRWLIQWMI